VCEVECALDTARAELETEVRRAEILRYEIMLKKGGEPPVAPLLEQVVEQSPSGGEEGMTRGVIARGYKYTGGGGWVRF